MKVSRLINLALNQPLEDPKTKKKNSMLTYSDWDKLKRFFNSPAFDRASYEADGGDDWMQSGRLEFYKHPKSAGLYQECQEQAGNENEKFTIWLYLKRGGKF